MATGKLLTIRSAAQDRRVQELGISEYLMRRAVDAGQLRTVRISTMRLIPPAELDKFVESVSNPRAELRPTAA